MSNGGIPILKFQRLTVLDNKPIFVFASDTDSVNYGVSLEDLANNLSPFISGSAGGDNTQIQFNNNNALDGDSNLTYDSGTQIVQLGSISRIHMGVISQNSAALGINSTTRGFLPPRMTTVQRDAISVSAADAGLEIYNTDNNRPEFWNGTLWSGVGDTFTEGSIPFANSSGALAQDNANFFWDDSNNRLGIGTNTPTHALDITSSAADTTAITAGETTGTNGGITNKFVGNRDPNGNVTASGGAEYYRDSADTSATFESLEATTGTNWFRRCINPSNIIEIHNSAQFEELASGGVISITVPTLLLFKNPSTIVTASIFNNTAELTMAGSNDINGNNLFYTGTGTFITSTSDISLQDRVRILAGSTGKLFDMTGGVLLIGAVTFNAWDLGIIRAGRVFITNATIGNHTAPLVMVDTDIVANLVTTFIAGNLFSIVHLDPTISIIATISKTNGIQMTGPIFRIDPHIDNDSVLEFTGNSTGSDAIPLFDVTGGSTGTYTAVADNSLASTSITSVTDSSGIAVFNVASAPLLGSTVTNSGYVTNTAYNGIFIVSARTATTFRISDGTTEVVFGSDEATGDVISSGITITSAAHGLDNDDTLQLSSSFVSGVRTTDYDGGYTIYNVQTNSFDVEGVFVATQTGSWDTSGLDQKNPNVLNLADLQGENSNYTATAFVNNNTTANGAIVNNTFTDMVFGTAGSALVEGSTIERWKLVDELNGTFEYTGNEPFDGFITFDFTVTSTGGTVDFRFKWEHDIGAGFVDLPDNVEALVAVGSDAQSVTKTFPLEAVKGDQIKPQITRNSGSSGITTMYATVYVN